VRNSIVLSLGLGLCLGLVPLDRGQAQFLTRPHRDWRTVRTERFDVHFPADMQAWTEPVVGRLEAYAAAVDAMVGNRPSARVTVLVEDPSNVSNGFAVPLLEGPVIFLWPTPPTPSPTFGDYSDWGELLALHEYAHISHLSWPPRNPRERLLWRWLPSRISPVSRKAPSWVIEGYATYLEGVLTGNGRPQSAGRAAVLRQWAIEGRLPTYAQLSSVSPFFGGAMRYLVGSAFLEWLAERKGAESHNHLWRRMSARQQRSFSAAFTGVYGASPEELYGRFFAEVMRKALSAEDAVRGVGLRDGVMVQRRYWSTGEPAVSKDGKHVALVLRSPFAPSRLVVWNTADDVPDTAIANARRRLIERDPLDVPAIDSFPRPARAIATLHPVVGRPHESPRWFADGERLLVVRDEPLGDGATRPDLFVWNRRTRSLDRITRGAAIRQADPAPDGRTAAGVRCAAGICDVVRVDLTTGAIAVIASGSPSMTWHRARWSLDGTRIAASVHRDGRWHVAVIAGGDVQVLDPGDGAARHSPVFSPDGRSLIVVSERGGIANLELLEIATGRARTLTRVTGAVAAPDVGPDSTILFLDLHARGLDVRRLSLGSAFAAEDFQPVVLDSGVYPAGPPAARDERRFSSSPAPPARGYGAGPRHWRYLPGVGAGPDGKYVSLMVSNSDPIGRLGVVVQGGAGSPGAWRGGSLGVASRFLPIELQSTGWLAEHEPSRQGAGTFADSALDVRYYGLGVAGEVERDRASWRWRLRSGGSAGTIDGPAFDDAIRRFVFADGGLGAVRTVGRSAFSASMSGRASAGVTAGQSWRRADARMALAASRTGLRLGLDAALGTTTRGDGAGLGFERFTLGGQLSPFIPQEFLTQRIVLPAVPFGVARGGRLEMYRASTTLTGWDVHMVWASLGDSGRRFQRFAMVEQELAFPAIGFAGIPSVTARFGAGYSFDEPFRKKARAYAGVIYRP
jgi:hypothetical protein